MKTSKYPFLIITALSAIFITGCEEPVDPPYETYFQPQKPYTPQASSGNAYDAYLIAAQKAEEDCGEYLDRTNFTPGVKKAFTEKATPALNSFIKATSLPSQFKFVPSDPFLPDKNKSGLLLLARAITFETEAAITNRDWPRAVTLVLAATKFASDYQAGDTTDAAFGFDFAAGPRQTLAPHLGDIPPAELQRLGKTLLLYLSNRPSDEITIENEGENFMAGIQFIQDHYKAKDFETLEAAFYKAAHPAIDYLRKIDVRQRPGYFHDFSQEALEFRDYYVKESIKPAAERQKLAFDSRDLRPWKRFSAQLFGTLEPFLALRDQHLARTRLMALSAIAQAQSRSTGQAPLEFTNIPAGSTIDPYSGRPFPYRVANSEFRIYSVGPDGKDDGGLTDDSGNAPDLVLITNKVD